MMEFGFDKRMETFVDESVACHRLRLCYSENSLKCSYGVHTV